VTSRSIICGVTGVGVGSFLWRLQMLLPELYHLLRHGSLGALGFVVFITEILRPTGVSTVYLPYLLLLETV